MKTYSIHTIFISLIILFIFGCTENAEVIQPVITDISPESDGPGVTVQITGQGFGADILAINVDFNGVTAEVLAVSDSMVSTKIPEGASTGKINIQIGSQQVSSIQDFVVLEGKWTEKKSIPFEQGFAAAVGFSYGGKGYLGTGTENGAFIDQFWEYDPTTNEWISLEPIPNGRRHSSTDFVLGDFAYVGLGRKRGETDFTDEFYKYDILQNSWSQISSFPGTLPDLKDLRVGFSYGNKAYIVMEEEVWEYDSVLDEWNLKTSYPGEGVAGLVAEVVGEYAYIGTGFNAAQDWWRYDIQNNEWFELNSYPTENTWGLGSFVIQDKIYLIGRECWEYDPADGQWTRRTSHPDGRRFATAFSIGDKGYLGAGISFLLPSSPFMKDLWEFDPN